MQAYPVFRTAFGCGLGLLLAACISVAQEPGPNQPKANPPLSKGLQHVPHDAIGFIHFRLGDFLKNPVGTSILHELRKDREAGMGLKKFEQTLGIDLSEMESITLLMLSPSMQRYPLDVPGRNSIFRIKPPFNKGILPEVERGKTELKFEKEKQLEEKPLEELKPIDKFSPILFQEQESQPRLRFDSIDPRDFYELDPGIPGSFLHSMPMVVVTSTKILDRKKILRAQFSGAKSGDPHGDPMRPMPSVLFLSDHSLLMGNAFDLARYSELMARKLGPKAMPLRSSLALGAEPHLVVAGGHIPVELRRMLLSQSPLDLQAFTAVAPLLLTEAGLTVDLGDNLELRVQFQASSQESAGHVLQAVKTLRVVAELALEKSRHEAGEPAGWKRDLDQGLTRALADARIEQKGMMVLAHLKLEISPTLLKRLSKDFVSMLRSRGDRAQSVNNLKQIGIALHSYHDAYGALPPAGIGNIRNEAGKPLLSWRVAILPFIEQQSLYQQFDLNLPWDHPHNKKLIARMPSTYVLPGADAKEGMTNYRVLVGAGTMFEPRPGGKGVTLREIVDGTANTIMVVEANEATVWTRPDDLPYGPKKALPKFGVESDGFNVLLGDGSVRFIRATISEQTLHHAITINDGQPLGSDW